MGSIVTPRFVSVGNRGARVKALAILNSHITCQDMTSTTPAWVLNSNGVVRPSARLMAELPLQLPSAKWNVPGSGARHGFLSVRLPHALVPKFAQSKWLLAHCTLRHSTFAVRLVHAESREFSRTYHLALGQRLVAIALDATGAERAQLSIPRGLGRAFKLTNSAITIYAATVDQQALEFWINALQLGTAVQYASPPTKPGESQNVCLFCGGHDGPWLPRPQQITLPAYNLFASTVACSKCIALNRQVLLRERHATYHRDKQRPESFFRPHPTPMTSPSFEAKQTSLPREDSTAAVGLARALLAEASQASCARRQACAALAKSLEEAARDDCRYAVATVEAALRSAESCGRVSTEDVSSDFGLPLDDDGADVASLAFANAMLKARVRPDVAACAERWKSFVISTKVAQCNRTLSDVNEELVAECVAAMGREIAEATRRASTRAPQKRRSPSTRPRHRKKTISMASPDPSEAG